MHNRSASYGELTTATFTFPAITLGNPEYLNRTTLSTMYPIRPTDALKSFSTVMVSLKFIHQGYKIKHGSRYLPKEKETPKERNQEG